MADFKADRKSIIGVGESSVVYAGASADGKENVAIKAIDLERVPLEAIEREVTVNRRISHPNIVPLLYCGEPSHEEQKDDQHAEMWLVMPLYKMSVQNLLRTRYAEGIPDMHIIATILHDVCTALQYLHESDIIHRDIKGGNIMIDDEGKCKLADFGISAILLRDMNCRAKSRRTFTGSIAWMAPEVMEQTNGYTISADVWSLGILAFELAYGFAPYIKYNPLKVLMMTLQNDPPTPEFYRTQYQRNGKLPDSFESLIRKCLRKDPSRRPTIKKLLTHKFFKKFYREGSTIV
jgi:serine/threonine-protein kinase OSR1/STK39